MDPFFSSSQDFLIIIVLPLMVMTLRSAWIERQTLWDANVTARDRDLLMRITMFVLMPIVVFLHECGHAAAILQFGGKIAKFHYGILWGLSLIHISRSLQTISTGPGYCATTGSIVSRVMPSETA